MNYEVQKKLLGRGSCELNPKKGCDFPKPELISPIFAHIYPRICFFIHPLTNFLTTCIMTDTLCYSYSTHQHLTSASQKKRKVPPTFRIWPGTYGQALLFPVEHKQSHKTATSHRSLCDHDRSKDKIRSFLIKSEHP